MSCPISSIPNPLNPAEILLFYLTEGGNVGIDRHNYKTEYAFAKFNDNGVPDVDHIVNPGSFTALTFGGLVLKPI
jgi:hypothetical protein